MKKCKKLLCLVLALVMALSLCTVAMADGETGMTEPTAITSIEFTLAEGVFVYGESTTVGGSGAGGLSMSKVNGANWDTSNGLNGAITYTDVAIVNTLPDTTSEPSVTTDSVFKAAQQYYLRVKVSAYTTSDEGASAKFNYTDTDGVTGTFTMKISGDSTETVYTAAKCSGYAEITGGASVYIYFNLGTLSAITDYSSEIPFTKVVKLGGNTEPGAQTFTLKQAGVVDATITGGNNTEVAPAPETNVSGSVDTNGAGTYTNGELVVFGDKIAVNKLLYQTGFYVEEVDVNKEGWDCDGQVWFVKYVNTNPVDGVAEYACRFWKATKNDNGYTYDANEALDAMTFTNTYTENTTHEHTRRQPTTPTTPEAPKPVASPKTGDMGVALYAAMAVLSMSGSAVIIGKKRSK